MSVPETGYELIKTGTQIDDILARAAEGGAIDNAIAAKAPIDSPTFTGTPKAPIPADGADNDQIATVKTVSDAASAVDQVAIVDYIQNPNATLWNAISDAYTAGKEVILKRSTTSSGVTTNYFYALDYHYNNNNSSPYYERFSFVGTENGNLLKRYTLVCNHLNSTYSWESSTTQLQEKLTFDDAPTENSNNPAKSGGIYSAIETAKQDAEDAAQEALYNQLPTDTASGAIVTFPDGANNIPVKSLIAQITPVQAGSGDPSPDNIRPISGWTGAKITVNSGNFLPPISAEETYRGVTFTPLANGSTRIHGTATSVASKSFTGDWVSDGLPKYVLYTPTASDVSWYLWDATVGAIIGSQVADLTGYQFTAPKGHSVNLCVRVASEASVDVTFIPAFGVSADITPNPYVSNEIDIDWTDEAGTVYGGTLTYIGGGKYSLQPNKKYYDGATLEWNYSSTYATFWAVLGDVVTPTSGVTEGVISSNYATTPAAAFNSSGWGAKDDYSVGLATSSPTRLCVKDSRYTDAATFKLAMNGVQLVYDLETLPDPIILDAEDVKTPLGDNNIFCDTGDVDVTYRADIAKYIAKKIAEA